MKRGTILLLGAFLVAAFAPGCDGSGSPSATTATPAPPVPSPSPDAAAAPYDDLATGLAVALEREDGGWFADQASPSGLAVYEGGANAFRADGSALRDLMEEAFAAAGAEAEDAFGTGEWRLYAVGEEALPLGNLVVHLVATGILSEPDAGRWAFVFKATRTSSTPEAWSLFQLVQAPPAQAGEALALGALPAPEADPAALAQGFVPFLEDLERAFEEGDAAALASMLRTRPYTCTQPQDAISEVPACEGRAPGDVIDLVGWADYCLSCEGSGFATPDVIEQWLDALLAGSPQAQADAFGPPEFRLEAVSLRPEDGRAAITFTGIGRLAARYPDAGRWALTLNAEHEGGEWFVTDLLLADPGQIGWFLPSLRGTNIVWTRWRGIE